MDMDKKIKVGDREYREYELEGKVRTLQEAQEIENDPELLAALEPYLTKAVTSIKSLKQLRARAARLSKQGR